MGLGFGFGGKGFRVNVSRRGVYTRVGNSKGLHYSGYHSFKGKKGKHTSFEPMSLSQAELETMKKAKEEQESDLGLMKFCSFFMKLLGVIMVLLGLVLMVVPPVGLVVIGLGVVFFIKGNNYSKRVKILKNEELKKQVK